MKDKDLEIEHLNNQLKIDWEKYDKEKSKKHKLKSDLEKKDIKIQDCEKNIYELTNEIKKLPEYKEIIDKLRQ